MSKQIESIAASLQDYFPNGGRDWNEIVSLATAICSGKINGLSVCDANKYDGLDWHAEPIIKWMNENCNPHSVLIIDGTSAVLYTGEKSVITDKFLND